MALGLTALIFYTPSLLTRAGIASVEVFIVDGMRCGASFAFNGCRIPERSLWRAQAHWVAILIQTFLGQGIEQFSFTANYLLALAAGHVENLPLCAVLGDYLTGLRCSIVKLSVFTYRNAFILSLIKRGSFLTNYFLALVSCRVENEANLALWRIINACRWGFIKISALLASNAGSLADLIDSFAGNAWFFIIADVGFVEGAGCKIIFTWNGE